jgi:hypothetical protein
MKNILLLSKNENIVLQNLKFNEFSSSTSKFNIFNIFDIFNNNDTIEQNQLYKTQLENKLFEINRKLDFSSLKKSFPVVKVYITFETENNQRLCLHELEVPDLKAMLNIVDYSKERVLFRGNKVLDVQEPPKPDNILWSNL